jgi:tetratricopeptide (TPR) repeat protein
MALDAGDGYLCLAIRCFETMGALLGGQWGLALQIARDGIELANKNGHRRAADFLRLLKAWLALEASALEEAASICDSVLAAEPNKQAQFIANLLRAGVWIRQERFEEALPALLALREAIETKTCLPGWIFHLPMHYGIAQCQLAAGRLDAARCEALRLVRITEEAGEKNWAALGRLLLSRIARATEDHKTAESELAAALRHCEEGRNPLAAWRVYSERALFSREKQAEYHDRAAAIVEQLAQSLPPGQVARTALEAAGLRKGAGSSS